MKGGNRDNLYAGHLYDYQGHRIRYWGKEVEKERLITRTFLIFFEVKTDSQFRIPYSQLSQIKKIHECRSDYTVADTI